MAELYTQQQHHAAKSPGALPALTTLLPAATAAAAASVQSRIHEPDAAVLVWHDRDGLQPALSTANLSGCTRDVSASRSGRRTTPGADAIECEKEEGELQGRFE